MEHRADDHRLPRLKANVWVAAYIRRCVGQGAFAALSRHGDDSAGAIFIEILHKDGVDLWAPAPLAPHRAFERVLKAVPTYEAVERMDKEAAFDSDLWLVTVEDRAGRDFLEADERDA